MKIATLGPKGTFSHEAVLKRYKNPEINFENTIWDIFEAVTNGDVEEGVVPIENSISGTVGLTLDALMEFDLNIIGEITLPVRHNLVGPDGMKGITTLYVHPVTYEQCEKFIRKNLPDAKIIQTSSNAASAVKIAKQEDKTKAAIVPSEAIDIYNLNVIKKNIQDNKFNVTKFIVIGKGEVESSGSDRTSITIYPQVDKPGLLYDLLGVFAKRKINLSKIESRPSKGKLGDYIFYIDLQGHKDDNNIKDAFKEIEKHFFLKVLGSYSREY